MINTPIDLHRDYEQPTHENKRTTGEINKSQRKLGTIRTTIKALVLVVALAGNGVLTSSCWTSGDGEKTESSHALEVDTKASIKRLPVVLKDEESSPTYAQRIKAIQSQLTDLNEIYKGGFHTYSETMFFRTLTLADCLRPGDRDGYVRELQTVLNSQADESMHVGSIDGIYGEHTRKGVDNFLKPINQNELMFDCDDSIETASPKSNTLPMSKAEFSAYFSGHIEQSALVGNCTTIASIHAFSLSPYFEIMVRSSVKRMPDNSWEVRIPMMSNNSHVVKITPDDIAWQFNNPFDDGTGFPILTPVDAHIGFKVLEAAYIKEKNSRVDRDAAKGSGADFFELFLGNNFGTVKIFCLSETCFYEQLQQRKTGKQSVIFKNLLRLFRKEEFVTIAGSKKLGAKPPIESGHAYSIVDVDYGKLLITIANPWETNKPIQITFQELKDNFDLIIAAKVRDQQILDNIKAAKK